MHAYDRSLINITLAVPCLVSINSSSDDLIESEHYMLIPMQHISVPSGLAALAAIPPNSRAVLTRATSGMTSGDFLAAGQTDTGTNKKLFKK